MIISQSTQVSMWWYHSLGLSGRANYTDIINCVGFAKFSVPWAFHNFFLEMNDFWQRLNLYNSFWYVSVKVEFRDSSSITCFTLIFFFFLCLKELVFLISKNYKRNYHLLLQKLNYQKNVSVSKRQYYDCQGKYRNCL